MKFGADFFLCCQQLFKNFGSQHWADVELGICICIFNVWKQSHCAQITEGGGAVYGCKNPPEHGAPQSPLTPL